MRLFAIGSAARLGYHDGRAVEALATLRRQVDVAAAVGARVVTFAAIDSQPLPPGGDPSGGGLPFAGAAGPLVGQMRELAEYAGERHVDARPREPPRPRRKQVLDRRRAGLGRADVDHEAALHGRGRNRVQARTESPSRRAGASRTSGSSSQASAATRPRPATVPMRSRAWRMISTSAS